MQEYFAITGVSLQKQFLMGVLMINLNSRGVIVVINHFKAIYFHKHYIIEYALDEILVCINDSTGG